MVKNPNNPTREQVVEAIFDLLIMTGLVYDDDDECDIKDRLCRSSELSGIYELFTGSKDVPEPADDHVWEDCECDDDETEDDYDE